MTEMEELLALIGAKEVIITRLKREITRLEDELRKLPVRRPEIPQT